MKRVLVRYRAVPDRTDENQAHGRLAVSRALLCLIIAATACSNVDMETEVAALRSADSLSQALIIEGNAQGLTAFFDDEAMNYPPNDPIEGGETIQLGFEDRFGVPGFELTRSGPTRIVIAGSGDLGYTVADEEITHIMQERGQALLAENGYRQYEVSAFARDDKVCAHNLNYWLFGDYLAAGAGAHGKVSNSRGVFRYQKPAHPLQYMKTIEAGEQGAALVPVAATDLVFEFMLNALRLSDGFSDRIFRERTGLSADELPRVMREACKKGLVARQDESRWRATPLGRRFLNDLQAEFLPEKS